MRLKKNIWKILLFVVVSCAGVFLGANDTYAKDNFFSIKVSVNCDNKFMLTCGNAYPVKVTKKNNGGYKVSVDSVLKDNENITIKTVDNEKLVIIIGNTNGCIGTPPETISVGFKDDIDKFRDAVNTALSSVEYTQSCDQLSVGSSKTYNFEVGTVGEKIEATTDNDDGSSDSDSDGDVSCTTSGALSSLGWILCPVLSLMSDTVETFYDEALVPFLTIEPELFTTGDDDNNVLAGWTVFQNIANVLFAILLLVVIFSQLTGVGINNYGIKKILPKLIVTAVLINLSYFICILLVDISNVLGNAIQSLFDGLANGLDVTNAGSGGFGGFLSGMGTTALTGAGVFVALYGATGFTVAGGAAFAVSLLISGLGVLISLLFLFLILAVRQAAVVVLIVIAPLAVVCYALPNTKSLFDKWVKLMKVILILYPICGLLVGGGNYVSKLLLSTGMGDSFFGALTAMLAGIVPVLFIPTLAKSALAGIGNLGAKISGIGDKARGGITGAAKNSQVYKNAQERAQMDTHRRMAGLDEDGKERQLSRVGRLMRGGTRGMSIARAGYLKDLETKNQRANMMVEAGMAAAIAGVEDKAKAAQVANYESLLSNGRAVMIDSSGQRRIVNSDNHEDLQNYHLKALRDHATATDVTAREDAMARIKASQNMLSKFEDGRGYVQSNFETLLNENGDNRFDSTLKTAAASLLANHGETYKSKNRGANKMLLDIASGRGLSDITEDVKNKKYDKVGWDKYTAETIGGADEGALDRIIKAYGNGTMEEKERIAFKETIESAINKDKNGNLNLKPEIRKKFKEMLGTNNVQNDSTYFHVDQNGGTAGE